jgi:hypothetical protein
VAGSHDLRKLIYLVLQQQGAIAVEGTRYALDFLLLDLLVCPGKEYDGVLPGIVDLNVGVPGRAVDYGHMIRVHTHRAEFVEQPGTVRAYLARVVNGGPCPAEGGRLIGAFTTGEVLKRRAGESFSGAGDVGHAVDVVDIERTEIEHFHENILSAKRSVAGAFCPGL